MFRNRELLLGITFVLLITGASAVVYGMKPAGGGIIIFIDGIIYGAGFYLFFRRYYRRLQLLSSFLRKSQYGLLPLETDDQHEGEFAILKSEIFKLLTRLHSQTELLEKEKQYLADTISDISHQLKTPMTSMNVMIDLLKDPKLLEENRIVFIRTLHSQLARMEWLLSAMLTMSKLDAGTLILKKEKVCTGQMLNRALEHLLISMELREQSVIREGEEDVSYAGDAYWSSEALSNILKNCMEHTPNKGTIRINTSQNPIYTSIRIINEGSGISSEDLPHIFERFYRGQHTSPDSVGIGLALANKLIRLQNGSIEVSSDYGKSATFLIKFYHYNI